MNQCRRCGVNVPQGHGFCLRCAIYEDAFNSGSQYADDFEGTTKVEAEEHAMLMVDEGSMEQFFAESDPPLPANAKELYIEGLVAGLKAAARENARIQAILQAED